MALYVISTPVEGWIQQGPELRRRHVKVEAMNESASCLHPYDQEIELERHPSLRVIVIGVQAQTAIQRKAWRFASFTSDSPTGDPAAAHSNPQNGTPQ